MILINKEITMEIKYRLYEIKKEVLEYRYYEMEYYTDWFERFKDFDTEKEAINSIWEYKWEYFIQKIYVVKNN